MEFTFNIGATFKSATPTRWGSRIGHYLPQRRTTWWKVTDDESAEEVAQQVIETFENYLQLAIEAFLETPGRPGDEAQAWRRQFAPPPSESMPLPGSDEWNIKRRGIPLAVRRAWSAEEVLDMLDHGTRIRKSFALGEINDRPTLRDLRTAAILREKLEGTPWPSLREFSARVLGLMPFDELVTDTLTAASREDPEFKVRWEAMYALALRPRMVFRPADGG